MCLHDIFFLDLSLTHDGILIIKLHFLAHTLQYYIAPYVCMVYVFFMVKQSHFFQELQLGKKKLTHGGEVSRGKRKTRRPLDTKRPLHLVMRAEKARGQLSLLTAQNKILVEKIIRKQSAKFGIRIAAFANVGNHLHLMLRFSRRKALQAFLVSLTALIARAVTRARKGHPFGKFWDALAFTRVLTSRREISILKKYIQANVIEAARGRDAREGFLFQRNAWEQRLYSS